MAPVLWAAFSAMAVSAATAVQWPEGSAQAFVHLFEWSWEDVATECEQWLGPKGFTAVQISPANEHNSPGDQGNSWYLRYQPVSYKLVSWSGNKSQFESMVKRCKAVGVGVYADAVINHQAPYSGVGVAGSHFGDRHYPLYSPEDFHHIAGNTSINCGVSNYDDLYNVQHCDLAGLPDLCTECPEVQQKIADYINHMAEIGIAGIRVDAAKNMNAADLHQVLARVNRSLFVFQEVVYGGAVQASMYYDNGPVSVFGYGSALGPKFLYEGQLREDLASFGETWGLGPQAKAVVFMDNHDTQRGDAQLTYKTNWEAYRLANIFMLAHPYGYPRIMSSYAFDYADQPPPGVPVHKANGQLNCWPGPWVCEHRNIAIANMVAWRRSAGALAISWLHTAGNMLAFCRGDKACVALNRGGQTWEVTLQNTLKAGAYCDVIQSDDVGCPSIHVGSDGSAQLRVPPRGAVAFHVGALKRLV
mmetsp:Transcript_16903/g.39715  ORF Transcript_16903/g.39715 Transcript_16903/m.39715 type:complete len:473 (+) Transcript_16903:65-1483(+)